MRNLRVFRRLLALAAAKIEDGAFRGRAPGRPSGPDSSRRASLRARPAALPAL